MKTTQEHGKMNSSDSQWGSIVAHSRPKRARTNERERGHRLSQDGGTVRIVVVTEDPRSRRRRRRRRHFDPYRRSRRKNRKRPHARTRTVGRTDRHAGRTVHARARVQHARLRRANGRGDGTGEGGRAGGREAHEITRGSPHHAYASTSPGEAGAGSGRVVVGGAP